MPNCPKCGARVTEAMSFCPSCGASLKAAPAPEPVVAAPAPAPQPRYERREKEEKGEKREKSEKGEKHEKRGSALIGPIIGGIVLIVLGVIAWLALAYPTINWQYGWAVLFVIIGIVIIVYAALMASRRSPQV